MGAPVQNSTTPTGNHSPNVIVLAGLLQDKLNVRNAWIAMGGESPIDRSRFSSIRKKFVQRALREFYPKLLDSQAQRSHLNNLMLNHYQYLSISNFFIKEIGEAAQNKAGLQMASSFAPIPGSYEKLMGILHSVLTENYIPFDFVNGFKNGYVRGLLDKDALAEVCKTEGKEKVQKFLDSAIEEWHTRSHILQNMTEKIDNGDQVANVFSHASMCVYQLLKAAKEEVSAL